MASLSSESNGIVRPPVTVKYTKLFINGEFVDSASGKTFETLDPRTEEVIASVSEATKEDVDLAVKAAREAFDHGPWPRMSGYERGLILYKFADLVLQHSDELAALETFDNGKPLDMSRRVDLPFCLQILRYFAGSADKIHGLTLKMNGPYQAHTLHEPIGVVGQIIPWNYPLLNFFIKVSPALACGCTVVIKSAEQTPLTALYCGQLGLEAGIPPGVLNVLSGFGETAGAAMTSHMDIDKISFTGSTEVGRLIMEASAKSNLKPVTLELGGKSPLIIMEDADIDKAVDIAHLAVFTSMGQVCAAGSRVFVQESIYDEFVKKAVERVKQQVVGDPFKPGVHQGPQIDKMQFEKVLKYIQHGKEEGANLLTGGSALDSQGFYIQPTIFSDVQDDMLIAKEEIFGPVMSILKFKYGDIFKTHILGCPCIMIASPEAARFVLVKQAHLFKPTFPKSKECMIGPQALFFHQGEYHAQLRKLVQRSFLPEAVKSIVTDIESIQLKALESWEGNTINTFQEMKRLSFQVALLSIFGKDEVFDREDLKQSYSIVHKGYNSMPINLPGTLFHRAMKARKHLSEILNQIIAVRRANNVVNNDLLGSLMQSTDGSSQVLTDDQIADNIIGVIFAAQDTTASVLTWIIKYLRDHPSFLEAVTAEQEAIRRAKGKDNCLLTWEDTKKMPLTCRVIQETLRVASILSFTFREAVADVEYKGYLIPKGWKVMPLFRNLHHSPEFFPDPQKFDPSRFEVPQKPNTFMPFGSGAHSCPGNELAKLEMLILIHHMTTKYRWDFVGTETGIQYGPFPVPMQGLPIKVSHVSAEQSFALRRRQSSGGSAVNPCSVVRQRTHEATRPATPHAPAGEPSGSHSGSRDAEDVEDEAAVGGEVPLQLGQDDTADGRDPPDPWEDDISRMTIRDIEGQRDRLRANILSIPERSPSSALMGMMLEAVENLLWIYRCMGPLGSLWMVSCQRRRDDVMGPDKWSTVRDAKKDCDVKGTLFDIPPDRAAGQPLRLKEFKLEAATPYIYDRFIGAWGIFPHHHQVPLYFARHLYVEFVLGMHPDYTSTGSSFYGAGGGRNATRPGARRDPAAQPEPVLLVGRPRPTVMRSEDVAGPSQLAIEERSTLAQATRMDMHGTMLAVQAERDRAPSAPVEPELP